MTTPIGSTQNQPREGDRALEFSLLADDGTTVTLESLKGRKIVLFFYPKDNTSG